MGWAEAEWNPSLNETKVVLRDRTCLRGEIPNFLSDEFWEAYRIWKNYRRYGLPNGRGWAEEPEEILRLIDLFEDEIALNQKREREDKEEELGHGGGHNRRAAARYTG